MELMPSNELCSDDARAREVSHVRLEPVRPSNQNVPGRWTGVMEQGIRPNAR